MPGGVYGAERSVGVYRNLPNWILGLEFFGLIEFYDRYFDIVSVH